MLGLIRSMLGGAHVDALTPADVHESLSRGALHLVDVREAGEWQQMRIAGAVHVPLSRLAQQLDRLPADKPIVFYCLSGRRSASAISLCRRFGMMHARHMGGGLSAWRAAGLPVQT